MGATEEIGYWKRARSWALSNTKLYTLPKALPPITAAILQLWLFKMRPMLETLLIIGTIVVGYFVCYGIEFACKLLFSAPAAIDKQHGLDVAALRTEKGNEASANAKTIRDLRAALDSDREVKLSLAAEIERLKVPKRTPGEEHRYQIVKATLEKYGQEEKLLLRHLQIHGKMVEQPMMKLYPLPAGLNGGRSRSFLGKFENDHLVSMEAKQIPSGYEYTWQIAPGMASALDELLHSDE